MISSESKSVLLSVAIPAHVENAFKTHSFRNWYGGLTVSHKELQNIEPVRLHQLLEEFFQSLGDKDPLSLLDDLAEIIPIDKLKTLAAKNGHDYSVKQMLDTAKKYLATIKTKSPSISAHLSQFLDSLLAIFESIIGAFGIADFLKPAESEIQTDFKFQRVMMQITLFTMLLSALIPVIGPIDAVTYVGGSFGSIWLLSVIYPHVRPRTSHLPKSVNWTKEVAFCRLACPGGRQTKVHEIANALIVARKEKRHVALLGESGVGKTETLKALTHAIARGVYPELNGLRVFYFNSANLVNSTEILGGGNKIIEHIKREGGRHLKKCILIFDEIALACRDKAILGDQLKTELDNADGEFATVIGVTTEMEFNRDILAQNPAVARRFKQIPIESTDKKQTVKVVDHYLTQKAPHILVDDGALEYAHHFTQKSLQPQAALNLMSLCVQKAETPKATPYVVEEGEDQPSSHSKDVLELYGLRQKIFDYKKKVYRHIVSQNSVADLHLKKIFLMNLLVDNLKKRAEKTPLFITRTLIDEVAGAEEVRQKQVASLLAPK